jgi:hypothetical protein
MVMSMSWYTAITIQSSRPRLNMAIAMPFQRSRVVLANTEASIRPPPRHPGSR